MRILYLNYVEPGTGPWIHASQFFASLKALHPDAISYPAHHREEGPASPNPGTMRRLNRTRRQFPLRGIRHLVRAYARKLPAEARVINQVRPDVVILRVGSSLSSIPLCRLRKIPLVLEVNAPLREGLLWDDEGRRRRFLHLWEQMEVQTLSKASHVIVVSEPLRNFYIERGMAPEKITAVPNGVDTGKFSQEVRGENVKQQLGLDGKTVIGFAGHFSPWHGLDFLFQSMQELYRERRDVVLLMIGQPKIHFVMPELLLKRTIVTGFVPYEAMPDYLAAVDIFVAPYPRLEPFYFSPLKIFEAMAMGRSIVASAQGQICDLITDGVNGYLYPPEDSEAFLEKLRSLVSNRHLQETFGEEARKRVQRSYTWEQNARTILNLCQRLTTETG